MVIVNTKLKGVVGHIPSCECNKCGEIRRLVVLDTLSSVVPGRTKEGGVSTVTVPKCGTCVDWAKGFECLMGLDKLRAWASVPPAGYPSCHRERIVSCYCTGCQEDKPGHRCEIGKVKRMVELNVSMQDCWRTTSTELAAKIKAEVEAKVETKEEMCMWIACKRWKNKGRCTLKNFGGEYGLCLNFTWGDAKKDAARKESIEYRNKGNRKPPGGTTETAITTVTKPVEEEVRAKEGVLVVLPDKTEMWLREDIALWKKPETYGAKAFVPAKVDDVIMGLRGKVKTLKIEPELLREPSKEWRLPTTVLIRWAAMMLDTSAGEMSCLYGKKIGKVPKGEPMWLGVVPKQEVTAGSVDVDDQGPALALLAKRGYKMVGSVHTHPGGMTSCSGTDTGEHWKHSGGVHIIVTRLGTTGAYFATGGVTWELREKVWEYGALWKTQPTDKTILREWQAEGTLITETGLKRIGVMVSRPTFVKRVVQPIGYLGHGGHATQPTQPSQRGVGFAGHSCYQCTYYKGKRKRCKEYLSPKVWGYDGLTTGCGSYNFRVTRKERVKAEAAGKVEVEKVSTLRGALMVMVNGSKLYTKEQKEWLEGRVGDWNCISSFFHDLLDDIGGGLLDKELSNLGPQVEEIHKRMKVMAIVMGGTDLPCSEVDYMIEEEWVGDPV